MTNGNDDFQKALELLTEHTDGTKKEFHHILGGLGPLTNSVVYPDHPEIQATTRRNVKATIQGSLVIYLFTRLEAHAPDGFEDMLGPEQLQKYRAYKHVRHSAAHGYVRQGDLDKPDPTRYLGIFKFSCTDQEDGG